jgi:Beta-1,3-glucanase
MTKSPLAFIFMSVVAVSGFSQNVAITGRVTDNLGNGVPHTVIRMGVAALFAETDANGNYVLGGTVANATLPNHSIKGTAFKEPVYVAGKVLFSLPQDNMAVTIGIYHLNGRFVKNILSRTMNAGNYSVSVAKSGLSSQFYALRVAVNGRISVMKFPSVSHWLDYAGPRTIGENHPALQKLAAVLDTLHATAPGYSIAVKPIEALTGAYDFALTKTTTWNGDTVAFWGDVSTIPTTPITFKIINRTNGVFADSQIYWAHGDNGTPQRLSTVSTVNLANDPAGRLYVMVGQTDFKDPKNCWDFEEHTTGGGTYNGNTTRVDGFGLPLTIRLHCADGTDITLGDDYSIYYQSRQSRFDEFVNEVPKEFTQCAFVDTPGRIPSGYRSGLFTPASANKDYYSAYIDSVWAIRNMTSAKPTCYDVIGNEGPGNVPALGSALNRHVADLDQSKWMDGTLFYQKTPCNFYSRYMHRRSLRNKCYGFPYDDYGNWAAFASHGGAQWLIIAVGY